MKENREAALRWLFDEEGEKIKSLRDPRKFGISLAEFSAFTGQGVNLHDLQELSREEALEYWKKQWRSHELDYFPSGLDYFTLDCGACCGFSNAIRWLEMFDSNGIPQEDYQRMSSRSFYWPVERTKLAIGAMAFARRRRHKAQPDWRANQEAWTNRVNRATRRAMGLLQVMELQASATA